MLDFNHYVARHGEFGVQAIIEQIERQNGIRINHEVPLEDRWNFVMQDAPEQQQLAA